MVSQTKHVSHMGFNFLNSLLCRHCLCFKTKEKVILLKNHNGCAKDIIQKQVNINKRKYQQRVLDVEMGSFTPLVFGTNGGMGNECQRFLKHLADKIAQKDTEPYHVVITWLRTQISFELLRSVHACVRGSRTPFRSKIEQSLDCKINAASADIWNTCLYAFT